jgi:hypothetical protein
VKDGALPRRPVASSLKCGTFLRCSPADWVAPINR